MAGFIGIYLWAGFVVAFVYWCASAAWRSDPLEAFKPAVGVFALWWAALLFWLAWCIRAAYREFKKTWRNPV